MFERKTRKEKKPILGGTKRGKWKTWKCGRGVARVSATLVIHLRERFFSAACRLCRFWKRCSVYSVVLETVVLSRWCFLLWWTGRENVWWPDDGLFMTDYFHAHTDATTHDILSHKHAFHVRACEKTVVFVMHATGVYSVYRKRESASHGPKFLTTQKSDFHKRKSSFLQQELLADDWKKKEIKRKIKKEKQMKKR